jgi:hypothetical protein
VAFAQEKKEDHKKEWHYKPNFMVGFDLLNTGASFFRIENCIRVLYPQELKIKFTE